MNALAIETYQKRAPHRWDIPLECWKEILEKISQEDLRISSLVCKDLLQVSNDCVCRIKLGSSDVTKASRIFNRFKFVTEVNLGCHVSDEILNLIRESLTSLTSITLWDETLSSMNSLMELFRQRRNLKRVDLAGLFVSRPMMLQIDELFLLMPEATYFRFKYQNFFSHSTLLVLLQNCPLLETLHMDIHLEKGTYNGNISIAYKHENVRSLRLRTLDTTNDGSVGTIASWCPNLEILMVELTCEPTTLEDILRNFSRLKQLHIEFGEMSEFSAHCDHITTSLESLTMRGDSTSYKSLKKISKMCPMLKKSEIQYHSRSVTRHTLKKIVNDLKELRSLVLLCSRGDQVPFRATFMKNIRPSMKVCIKTTQTIIVW